MTTTTRSREAQDYLDGVAAALADLPDDDRADLLDELAAHLDELATESEAPLSTRLGHPAEYAAELRASAGLPPAAGRRRRGAATVARLRSYRQRPAVVAAEEFFVVLRPAWWVLRAWVAVAMLSSFGQPTWVFGIVPGMGVSGLLGLVVLLGAVVASVQLGRRGRCRGRASRAAVAVLNVVAVLGLAPVLMSLDDAVDVDDDVYSAPAYVEPRVPAEGVYAAGEQVWNIYAYDAAGTMLHDVRLYDQDGTPLSLGLSFDPTKRQTLDASGQRVDNAFPYRYLDPGAGVVEDENAGPPIDAPPLLGVPTPTPSGGQTPSPSATASGRSG